MSYTEYKDMFKKCQNTAPYHLFIYDVVKSRNIVDNARQSNLIHLLFAVYEELERIEKTNNINILHKNENLYYAKMKKDENSYRIQFPKEKTIRADLLEPFLLSGDLIGFTIERNSLNSEQIDYIFEQKKKDLGINYSFHKANGFYETDKYEEGNTKYFRGYCIQQLEENSKSNKKEQEEIER